VGGLGCVCGGGGGGAVLWEASGDRARFSDPVDGAARSEEWLLYSRTSVSGRLHGCLNTHSV